MRKTNATSATTRTATGTTPSSEDLLTPAQTIHSHETRLRYRVGRLLGQGGFGQVYLATRIGRSSSVPQTVCIKVSAKIDGWLREAYFGQLLREHPRAIQVYDTFPLQTAGGRMLYCLALEYARHGDLSSFLGRQTRVWAEATIRREIAGILQVLGKLHRGQLLHRDLTPLNVFVCDGPRLKLGDFGIVRQQSDRRGVTARTLNPLMAPSDIFDGAVPKWQARDDVYQMGQLLGMLVKGDATRRIRTGDVRTLPCSDHLKEIIYRCIGERRKRYESAAELIAALNAPPPPLKAGILRSRQARSSRIHRNPERTAKRGDCGGQTRRRRRAQHAVREDISSGPRATQLAAGGGSRRGAQVDGDQTAPRTRASHHAA